VKKIKKIFRKTFVMAGLVPAIHDLLR